MVDDAVFTGDATQIANVTALTIGRGSNGNDPFQGWIDNVFAFSRALSVAELQAVRAGGTNAILALNVPVASSVPTNLPPVAPAPSVVLNELPPAGRTPLSVELANTSDQMVDLPPLIVSWVSASGTRDVSLAARQVSPGEHWLALLAIPGARLTSGDRILLYDAAKERVLDAQILQDWPQARMPDRLGGWERTTTSSLGTPNPIPRSLQVSFNEICYHAPPRYIAGRQVESDEQWIELHNWGLTEAKLGGW
jgi:hypothetical protein